MNRIAAASLVIGLLTLVSCNDHKKNQIVIQGENSSNLMAMQALKADYEQKSNTELIFKPSPMEQAFNKANQDFANKTGQYDIVLQYNFSLSSFVRNNYVYTLSELKSQSAEKDFAFESDLFPNVWKEVSYYYNAPNQPSDDQISPISYPFSANTMLLVYNKALFEDPAQQQAYLAKYGKPLTVPQDLATFRQVADFFTQPDKDLKGVCLEGATGGWLYYEFCNFLQAMGGKVMDKTQGWMGDATTKVLLDAPQAIAAADYYLSLKPFNAGNFSTVDGVEQSNMMKKGKVAMAMMWSDYVWGLIDDEKGGFGTRFGFAPGPGGKSMIAGGSFYINRQSKVPQQAFAYVRYLLSKDVQAELMRKGLCSPVKSAYDDPEVKKIPYTQALYQALNRADYMIEAGPDADMISTVITKFLQKLYNGEMTSAQAMSAAQDEILKTRGSFFK